MPFPKGYEWLGAIGPLPKVVREALALHGTKEFPGGADNPVIMGWAREITKDVAAAYGGDEIPWCGLFAAVVIHRAGYPVISGPLWAANWARFGAKSHQAGLGDILVFKRPGGGGHVGFYIAKSRCTAIRRPYFKIGQPASVKPYQVKAGGKLSTNEA